MQGFEYKVVPAPRRGEKARGVKTTEARFAFALTRMMNEMAAEGWEYLRADTLPVEERVGLTGRTTTFQHMLVFRRALAVQAAAQPVARMTSHRAGGDDGEAAEDIDPMDVAARRAALIARPQFGAAPRVSARAETGLAPSVGPAPGGQAAE
jgi:hypothetical protein